MDSIDDGPPSRWQEFETRWLPPTVPWSHDLLYDWEHEHDFAPDRERLHACLQDWLELLRTVADTDAFDLLDNDTLSASELVLAYLVRARERPAGPLRADLARELDRLLPVIERVHPPARHYDACKRLHAIREHLVA